VRLREGKGGSERGREALRGEGRERGREAMRGEGRLREAKRGREAL
jgi:hypothetical protein